MVLPVGNTTTLTINLIGVPDKKADFDGGNGARIFVDRTDPTTFYVSGGQIFEIIDHNGTNGYVGTNDSGTAGVGAGNEGDPGGAGIIFPYDDKADPKWRVQIWIRLMGPKGSEVDFKSYYYDTDNTIYVL